MSYSSSFLPSFKFSSPLGTNFFSYIFVSPLSWNPHLRNMSHIFLVSEVCITIIHVMLIMHWLLYILTWFHDFMLTWLDSYILTWLDAYMLTWLHTYNLTLYLLWIIFLFFDNYLYHIYTSDCQGDKLEDMGYTLSLTFILVNN